MLDIFVLAASSSALQTVARVCLRFEKDFHVSPFMSMKHTYDWKFTAPDATPGSGLMAQTTLLEPDSGKVFFDAKLLLKRCARRTFPRFP